MKSHAFRYSLMFLAPITCGLLPAPMASAADANAAGGSPPPLVYTAHEDHDLMMKELGVTNFPKWPKDNYDESLATRYPNLPDPLTLKNGQKVTTADIWWKQRRPEIVEDYSSEFYGRVPAKVPGVKWTVTSTTNRVVTNGTATFSIIEKRLTGHVDNSSYTNVNVDIQFSFTVPANAAGPVPLIMVFSGGGSTGYVPALGGFGGARGGNRGGGTNGAAGTNAPGFGGGRFGGGFAGGPGGTNFGGTNTGGSNGLAGGGRFGRGGFGGGRGFGGGGLQAWQATALSNGWGYGSLLTGSVQYDGAAGFSQGIIGLVNKGQHRKLDDWGVLRAWAWGMSQALDYLETDPLVDAKQVGLEGHSRDGKAA